MDPKEIVATKVIAVSMALDKRVHWAHTDRQEKLDHLEWEKEVTNICSPKCSGT